MNWTAISAVGTCAAVIVALFGDRLRAWLFPPSLEVALVSAAGERTAALLSWRDTSGQLQQRTADARYYYVLARNRRPFAPAHDVQIMLTKLEAEGPNGQPQIAASGPLPLTWKFPELHPLARTVGDEAIANLFFVIENKPLEFVLTAMPLIFPHRHQPPLRLWATIQARGIEGVSKPLRIAIAWDGKWEPGEVEMARHLQVSPS
jgi:hypothetical protein